MSSISSSLNASLSQFDAQSIARQRRQDFQQIAQSLQSGDLSGAQKAFDDFEKLTPNAAKGPLSNDFKALGSALQTGDLGAAQQAFSQLQDDIKNTQQTAAPLQPHHGHHHNDDDGGGSSISLLG